MGEDGQLYTVLLVRVVLLLWHKIVSGWWRSQQQGCHGVFKGFESHGGDYMCRCVYLCTRGTLGRTGSRRHRRQTDRALLLMWGARTSEGTGQGGQSTGD